MAELAVVVHPAVVSARPELRIGQVAVVLPNGHPWSRRERRRYLIVRVAMSVPTARARFGERGAVGFPWRRKRLNLDALEIASDETTRTRLRRDRDHTYEGTAAGMPRCTLAAVDTATHVSGQM